MKKYKHHRLTVQCDANKKHMLSGKHHLTVRKQKKRVLFGIRLHKYMTSYKTAELFGKISIINKQF